MSEHQPHSPEHATTHNLEREGAYVEHKHGAEKKTTNDEQAPYIESIKKSVEQAAISGKEVIAKHAKENAPQKQPLFVNKELKTHALHTVLNQARKHLSKPQRSFSRFIHAPVVDAASSVAEKTVARPAGLLAGSLCALIGSSIVLYMSKHYGFEYNLLLFIILFIGGFAFGSLVELLVFGLKKARRSK